MIDFMSLIDTNLIYVVLAAIFSGAAVTCTYIASYFKKKYELEKADKYNERVLYIEEQKNLTELKKQSIDSEIKKLEVEAELKKSLGDDWIKEYIPVFLNAFLQAKSKDGSTDGDSLDIPKPINISDDLVSSAGGASPSPPPVENFSDPPKKTDDGKTGVDDADNLGSSSLNPDIVQLLNDNKENLIKYSKLLKK